MPDRPRVNLQGAVPRRQISTANGPMEILQAPPRKRGKRGEMFKLQAFDWELFWCARRAGGIVTGPRWSQYLPRAPTRLRQKFCYSRGTTGELFGTGRAPCAKKPAAHKFAVLFLQRPQVSPG